MSDESQPALPSLVEAIVASLAGCTYEARLAAAAEEDAQEARVRSWVRHAWRRSRSRARCR